MKNLRTAIPVVVAVLMASTVSAENIVLTFGGDLMAHRPIHDIDAYDRAFTAVERYFHTDHLTFVNLEFVASASLPVSGFPLFNAPPDYVRAAVDAGVDVFSLANNHTFDHGANGIAGTVETLTTLRESRGVPWSSGIPVPGIPRWTPETIAVDNRRIGFLSVTEFSNERSRRGTIYDYVNVVDGSNREEFLRHLQDVTERYDLFILAYHGNWVEEYHTEIDPAKEALFYRFLDAGVHIVWGHHPHVPQETRLVSADGGNRLIMFSTGNLLSAQGYRVSPVAPDPADRWAPTHDSYLHRVTVAFDDDPAVASVELIPVFQRILPGRRDGVVIDTISSVLLREPDAAWRRYYAERYRILEQGRLVFE